jgi:hypothetical protein
VIGSAGNRAGRRTHPPGRFPAAVSFDGASAGMGPCALPSWPQVLPDLASAGGLLCWTLRRRRNGIVLAGLPAPTTWKPLVRFK